MYVSSEDLNSQARDGIYFMNLGVSCFSSSEFSALGNMLYVECRLRKREIAKSRRLAGKFASRLANQNPRTPQLPGDVLITSIQLDYSGNMQGEQFGCSFY